MGKRLTPRKLDEINAEYGYLCAQLGEASYRRTKLEHSIKTIMNRIDEVSEEALRAGGMQQDAKTEDTRSGVAESAPEPSTEEKAPEQV